jgi:hypothetical protein
LNTSSAIAQQTGRSGPAADAGWFLLRAYLYLGLLGAAATLAPAMSTAWLLLSAGVLALPVMLANWHKATVGTLLSLARFQPGRGLHWLGSRLVLARFVGAVTAIMFSASAIIHASLFGEREWLFLACAPLLFASARWALDSCAGGQFRGAAFRSHWVLKFSAWSVFAVMLGGWVWFAASQQRVDDTGLLEQVTNVQSSWKASPSAIGLMAADAFAWGQAVGNAATVLSKQSAWVLAIALVFAPIASAAFLTLSLSGLALSVSEFRRVFSRGPSAEDDPEPVSAITAGIYAAVAVVVAVILVQFTAQVEHEAKAIGSPAAAVHLPDCDAIDGKVYKLGTADAVRAALLKAVTLAGAEKANICSNLDEALRAAHKPVDDYLDWYFSLTAEWMRIWKMLNGELEQMLADRLRQTLESEKSLAEALARVGQGTNAKASILEGAQQEVQTLLKDNVLVMDERSCKVANRFSVSANLQEQQAQALRLRTAGSAGAGVAAGALAAKVAAKAMTKSSMKAATKVLAKFAAKKAAAASLSTAVGAAVGSVVPGLGTLVGAAVGTFIGLSISVAVDWASLAAEEQLTRGAMRAELLEEVANALRPLREVVGCAP